MSYKSPIDVVLGAIQTDIENGTFKAVREYGIFVDKDEMIKALKYDRDQYEKGYIDGYRAGKASVVQCIDCKRYRPLTDVSGTCHMIPLIRHHDDYCSEGERHGDIRTETKTTP